MSRQKGPLRIAIEDFFSTGNLSQFIADGIKKQVEKLEEEGYGYLSALFDKFGLTGLLPPELQNIASTGIVKRAQFDLLSIIGLVIGTLIAVVGGIIQSTKLFYTYMGNRWRPQARLDPATYHAIMARVPGWEDTARNCLKDLGYDQSHLDALYQMFKQRAPENVLLLLYIRGIIPDQVLTDELTHRNWGGQDIGYMIQALEQIPGASDIISMAVREAWNDDTASRFQYDEELPPELGQYLKQQGYKPEWGKRYWRAHWQLPGPSQAYEMLHRLRPGESPTPFSEQDLDMLLKAADYPAFFRERLKAISYAPYTRVDVRRMYDSGVLTVDDVRKNYLDLGYDAVHADKLTAWTIQQDKTEQKGLTAELIQSLYKTGLIARDEAVSMLGETGIFDENADFRLDLIDAQLEAQKQGEELQSIQSKYVNRELDDTSVHAALGALNLPAERVAQLLQLWAVQRKAKIHKPSVNDLEKWYTSHLIDAQALKDGILRNGYEAGDADLYIRQLNLENQADAAKEQERAQKEADRLAKLEQAKSLTVELAGLDAQIAEARLQIANIAVALGRVVDTSQQVDLQDQRYELQGEINAHRGLIADARLQLATLQESLKGLILSQSTQDKQEELDALRVENSQDADSIALLNLQVADLKSQIALADDASAGSIDSTPLKTIPVEIAALREQIAARTVQIITIQGELNNDPVLTDRTNLLGQIEAIRTRIASEQNETVILEGQIAEIETSLSNLIDPVRVQALKDESNQLKALIVGLQLQKAELKAGG